MKHKVVDSIVNRGNDIAQKYQYNGKELQDEFGIGWYAYQARNYDTTLGRWFNVDSLPDFKLDQTPYL
ncbi:MAG: hypothetical protein BM557_06680 [Flavobacterium sp. MedPE-SWcel]|uniref:RHS repeat-associated core domain-containing protein n=1 Tax=uncultured Flavobacterium sp. TaxID=165435 RepID=UPI0009147D60|nr:RHS repeat-associated core domain-containing protein [uncultured Flavobacterium sp.]OIQ18605.1 MAG: hypothetical protein BM557_06680 [Flavobacterium sp. MedPE-SWcel]